MLERTLRITFSMARKLWWQIGDVLSRVDVFSSAGSHFSNTVLAFSSLHGLFPSASRPAHSLADVLRPHPINNRVADGRAERSARAPNVPKRLTSTTMRFWLLWPFVYARRCQPGARALFQAKCLGLRPRLRAEGKWSDEVHLNPWDGRRNLSATLSSVS